MKKLKLTAMILAGTMLAGAVTACGSSDDADKYVKIGELEGLEIPVDSYTFTDEDVAEQMQQEFEYYVEQMEDLINGMNVEVMI